MQRGTWLTFQGITGEYRTKDFMEKKKNRRQWGDKRKIKGGFIRSAKILIPQFRKFKWHIWVQAVLPGNQGSFNLSVKTNSLLLFLKLILSDYGAQLFQTCVTLPDAEPPHNSRQELSRNHPHAFSGDKLICLATVQFHQREAEDAKPKSDVPAGSQREGA